MFHTVLRERVPTSRRCVGGGAHGVQGRGHRRRRCGHRCGRRRPRLRTRPTRWSSTPSSRTSATARAGSPTSTARRSRPSSRCSSPRSRRTSTRGSTSTTTPSPRGSTPGARSSTSRARGRSPTTASSWPPASSTPTRVFPASSLNGLYYVKNIRRAMQWDKVLDGVRNAVVVEASPLGLEMVTALPHRGIHTHLVDPHPWALGELADPDIVAPVQESWAEMGVQMHFNTRLEAFLGEGELRAVRDLRRRAGGRPRGHLHAQAPQRPARRGRRARGRDDRWAGRGRADGHLGAGGVRRRRLLRDPARRQRRPAAGPDRVATPTPRARWRAPRPGRHPAGPPGPTTPSTSPGAWSPAGG